MPKLETTTVKNARVRRLKDELNIILEMVTQTREALQEDTKDLSTGRLVQAKLTDKHIKMLKELTIMFRELTTARIALDKAEKQLEKEMTPLEEKQAVAEFIMNMPGKERGIFLKKVIIAHNTDKQPVWNAADLTETLEVSDE